MSNWPRYYPAERGRYLGSIGWGPRSTHWNQTDDTLRHRRNSIIWDWETRDLTVGISWYYNLKHSNQPYFSITLHLPFWRIWFKWEGPNRWP